ncbi:MAG: hypothetical protein ACI9GH_000668 [Candidatus Paceibacteria bacterium]|jgi:hypothetical protein
MKSIAQFKITRGEKSYIAEDVDLAIVIQADNLDDLVKNTK